MVRITEPARILARHGRSALLGLAVLSAVVGAQSPPAETDVDSSADAVLADDLPPYDIGPWMAHAAKRDAAWANVEWRQEVLYDLVEGQRVVVEPGTRTTIVRTQPGKTWAQLVDKSNHTVETYLVEGAQCLVERRFDFGPDKDPELNKATYTRMTRSVIPVAILSHYGWTWDGLSIENLGAAELRFLDAGMEEVEGRSLRKLVVISTLPSEDLTQSIQLVWLDENDSYLMLLREHYDAMSTMDEARSEMVGLYDQFLDYQGERYGLGRTQEVIGTEELAGFARPSQVRLEIFGSGRVESVEARLPDNGEWPAEAFALEIPPGAKVEEVGAGDT